MAGGNAYSVLHDHKNGWNPEMFRERYSEVLDRFDYIVGDWGYNQLRLKGFYRDGHPRALRDSTISALMDYINEYCNFGCAYFVLAKLDPKTLPAGTVPAESESASASESAAPVEGEAPAEAAAAVASGPLMRWPLKERPGGPVRIPGVSAIARAVQESAERRNAAAHGQAAQSGRTPDSRGSSHGRYQGQDGAGANAANRSSGRPSFGSGGGRQGGFGGHPSPGKPGGHPRGPKPQGGDRPPQGASQPPRHGAPKEPGRPPEHAQPHASPGSPPKGIDPNKSGGSRYPGKNRRRNRFGGKPNRPDGAGAPRLDGGPPNG